MTPARHKTRCDEDEHSRCGHFADFNEWLDGEEGQVFINEIRDAFSRNLTLPAVVWRVSELFTDTVMTTNDDRLLEPGFRRCPSVETPLYDRRHVQARPPHPPHSPR